MPETSTALSCIDVWSPRRSRARRARRAALRPGGDCGGPVSLGNYDLDLPAR